MFLEKALSSHGRVPSTEACSSLIGVGGGDCLAQDLAADTRYATHTHAHKVISKRSTSEDCGGLGPCLAALRRCCAKARQLLRWRQISRVGNNLLAVMESNLFAERSQLDNRQQAGSNHAQASLEQVQGCDSRVLDVALAAHNLSGSCKASKHCGCCLRLVGMAGRGGAQEGVVDLGTNHFTAWLLRFVARALVL